MYDSEFGCKSNTNLKDNDFKLKMTATTIENLSAIGGKSIINLD